jgi:type II secretory pathway component PulJ
MTLIELMIAISISAIIIVMIATFINAAAHSFRRVNEEVNLQMEAQTVVNQLTELMLEAKTVSRRGDTPTVEDKRFVIEGAVNYAVIFIYEEKKLYLVPVTEGDNPETIGFTEEDNLLAEYIEEFSIDDLDAKHRVKNIVLHMVLGEDDYSVTKKVRLRNAQ